MSVIYIYILHKGRQRVGHREGGEGGREGGKEGGREGRRGRSKVFAHV